MSNAVIVIKLPLVPDKAGAEILDGQSRICNWLYNNMLETANALRKNFIETQNSASSKTLYTKLGLRNLVPTIKANNPFLKVVHSSPLKNTALRLTDSIQTYQKSRKAKRKGKSTGWPKFRSWKQRWFSLFYDEPNKGYKVTNGKLQLSLGMGADNKRRAIIIAIKDANKLKDKKIHNLRLTKELGQFYAIFTISKELPQAKLANKLIALDPKHKNLAYGVDNNRQAIEIESPWWLKNYDKRVDELKAKRDKCKGKSTLVNFLDSNGKPTGRQRWEPSKRWTKYNDILDGVLKKRREQTKTYLYTVANNLYKQYDYVAIGNYTL